MPPPTGELPGGPEAAAAIAGNRSPLNREDMLTMAGDLHERGADENTTLGEFLEMMGLDLNAPAFSQLDQFTEGLLSGSDPTTQLDAIANGENARPNPGGLMTSREPGSPPLDPSTPPPLAAMLGGGGAPPPPQPAPML